MEPKCEVCGQHEATTFAYLNKGVPSLLTGDWHYCCDCTRERECYYIDIYDYLGRPTYWIEMMRMKSWWNEALFDEMLIRYRGAVEDQREKGA